jgi:hypothetical protein
MIEKIVEDLMDKGTKSKLKGWSMKDIVQTIEDKYGSEMSKEAKEYILKNYGV